MAATYTDMTVNDPINVANIKFMNDLIWSDADFTVAHLQRLPIFLKVMRPHIAQAVVLRSTLPAHTMLSCGAMVRCPSTSVSSPATYTVTVRDGCTLGTDEISVTENSTPSIAINGAATACVMVTLEAALLSGPPIPIHGMVVHCTSYCHQRIYCRWSV